MKKYLTIIACIILSLKFSNAQSVVISEYMNIPGNADGEWTELIVLDDYVDITGWKIRDNSDAESWRSGVTFKNINLWKSVSRGTIIVINHRYSGLQLDADGSDGYIEVTAADPNYFDIPADFESGGSLSINQQNDMIQLLDANGNNVHTLGHSSQSGSPWTDFQAIIGPKIMYNGNLANSASLRVFPGNSINDYLVGFDQNKLYTVANNSSSKGQPNKRLASDQQSNYEFWQSLRQPDWDVSKFSTNVEYFQGNIKITWEGFGSRIFDPSEGFMIVRIPVNQQADYKEPIDSKIYNVGDFVENGSGKVVGVISYLEYLMNEFSFVDLDFQQNAECDQSFFYRIYYYRYGKDFQQKDGSPETGRGRAYNPNPLSTKSILKQLPEKPKISTKNNRTEFCEDEDIELICSVAPSTENSLQWILDGTPIPGATTKTYKPTKAGQYVVKITNINSKCENLSDIFQITILPKPKAKLYQVTKNGKIPILRDTTFYVCKDEDPRFDFPVLELEGGNRLEWYFNDKLKNEEVDHPQTVAVQKGSYYGLVKNGECVDKTPTVFIEHIQYFFDINPNPLLLDADDNPTGEVTITNNSNVDVIISDPQKFKITNPAFSLVDVSFPLIIKKNQSIKVKINYQRTQNGKDETYILMVLDCFQAFRINLTGIKKAPGVADVVAFPSEFGFGIIPDCQLDSLTKKVTIKSVGTLPVKILNTIHSANVAINENLPSVLTENESLDINFKVINPSEGSYIEKIYIPYESVESNPKRDTLKIEFKYQIVHPRLIFSSQNKIPIPTCSDSAIFELEIENPTDLPLEITNNFKSPKVQIDYPVLPINLKAKEKVKLKILAISNFNDLINDVLIFSPCDNDTTITFELEKSNISIQIESNNHDFGVVPFCKNGMYPIKFNTKINVKGGTVKLKQIKGNNNFKVNINIDELIKDIYTLEFEYNGKNPGIFTDSIKLVFEPCDVTKELILTGMSVEPKIEVDPPNIVFGNVNYSQEYTQSINFRNLSPFALDFTFQTNNLEFKSSEYKLKIDAEKSGVLQITFKSDIPNTIFNDTLYIYTEPCAEIIARIPLQARTLSNFSSGIISIDLPEIISGQVADVIQIPIIHRTKNLNISKAGITQLKYYFSYNGLQLYPDNISPHNPTWKNIVETAILSEEEMGRATLLIKFKSNIDSTQSIDFNLGMLMLQTNKTTNPFKIDSVQVVSGGDIAFELDSMRIQTLENCRLSQRNIIFDNSEFIPKIEYKNDKINIEFHTPINGDVDISIYSSNGELLQNNSFSQVQHGTYQTQIDVSKYQSGVYFIEIRTPMGRFTKKIIIIR